MSKKTYLLILLLAACSAAQSADAPDAAHRKMAFMCTWAGSHMPDRVILQPCESSAIDAASTASLEAAMTEYWTEWGNAGRASVAEFEKAYGAKYPAPAHRYVAAEVQRKTVAQLCSLVHNRNTSAMALGELQRRNAFTVSELQLVKDRQIQVGMSQAALTCSWGEPEQENRTVTALGEHIQFVYGGKQYVYTVNGVVTAYQD